MIFHQYLGSPFGLIHLESDGHALNALTFCPEAKEEQTELEVFIRVRKWLDSYFAGKPVKPDFEMRQPATDFQRSVYEITARIPFGRVMCYGEIAAIIAENKGIRKMTAQAVGQALNRNRLMLVIPCHRVIGADGSLTGFDGGIELKRKLLKHEGIII